MKRRLKKSVIPVLYAFAAVLFVGTIFTVENAISNNYFGEEDEYDYVSEIIIDREEPVMNVEVILQRPYVDNEIKILKDFYDYTANEAAQQNSIIQYESTYLQNTGIIYGGKDNFDIVSILDGEVTDIKTDNLLGTIVEMKHTPDIISVYQSLSEVTVQKGDIVKQGQVIGKSGSCNIEPDLGSHVLFELIIKGQTVNPETYYDKKVSEI